MPFILNQKRKGERIIDDNQKTDLVAGPLRLYTVTYKLKENQYALHLSKYVFDVKTAFLSIIYPIETNGIRLNRLSLEFNSQIIYFGCSSAGVPFIQIKIHRIKAGHDS